jgi:hypothetical protein
MNAPTKPFQSLGYHPTKIEGRTSEWRKGSYLVITLTPAKTFRHAEYAPLKSAPERLQTLEF